MCGPTQARSPRARQNVLLSSAPQPSTGRSAASGRATLAGACPRERRRMIGVGTEGRRDGAQNRVVGSHPDRAVVEEEGIGDRAQPLARVIVEVGDRLVGDVARGHHQGGADVREQQMVKRRVGQHHAQVGGAGRHRARHVGVRPPASDDDRPRAVGQQALLGRGELDQGAGCLEVRRHQGQWPCLAMLARAQCRHRRLVGGDAGEVVAADALDREDGAGAEHRRGGLERIAAGGVAEPRPVGVDEPGSRAAVRARVRLRVKAAIDGIVVLGSAALAHLEAGHRGQRAVVGDAAHDREARAAVGAVGERVAVAAVGGIEDLGQAFGARGVVGRHQRLGRAPVLGLEDPEAALARRRRRFDPDGLDRRERRGLRAQPAEQLLDRLRWPLDLQHHPAAVVEHPAAEAELGGEPVHEGTKADPLDGAGDVGAQPPPGPGGRGGAGHRCGS